MSSVRRHDPPPAWSKVLTKNEQDNIWAYLDGACNGIRTREPLDTGTTAAKRLTLIVDLLVNVGLRASELVKLQVAHTPYVLGERVIEIRDSKYRRDRTVDLSVRLARDIETYITEVRPKTLPRHVSRTDFNKPLFYSDRRRPYTKRSSNGRIRASSTFNRLITDLGLDTPGMRKQLRPHMFRHTFAVNALRDGVDVRTLQAKMGHSSLTITERYLQLVNTDGLGEKLDHRPSRIKLIHPCKTA